VALTQSRHGRGGLALATRSSRGRSAGRNSGYEYAPRARERSVPGRGLSMIRTFTPSASAKGERPVGPATTMNNGALFKRGLICCYAVSTETAYPCRETSLQRGQMLSRRLGLPRAREKGPSFL